MQPWLKYAKCGCVHLSHAPYAASCSCCRTNVRYGRAGRCFICTHDVRLDTDSPLLLLVILLLLLLRLHGIIKREAARHDSLGQLRLAGQVSDPSQAGTPRAERGAGF